MTKNINEAIASRLTEPTTPISGRTSIVKYERRYQHPVDHNRCTKVVPVRVESTYDATSERWHVTRVTELRWPIPSIERDNEAKQADEDLYSYAADQYNTRQLLLSWHTGNKFSDRKPVLQEASKWPAKWAYLPLDRAAWEAHILGRISATDWLQAV